MKLLFYLILFTFSFVINGQETKEFSVNLFNVYDINFIFKVHQTNDTYHLSLSEQKNNEINFFEYLNYYEYSNTDRDFINSIISKSFTKTIDIDKYPKLFFHLNNIYAKASEPIFDNTLDYCGVDIFTKINNKTDLISAHKNEIIDSYQYLLKILKTEFNNTIIDNDVNPILSYFDINYLNIKEKPLVYELYPNYYSYKVETPTNFNFTKGDSIYLILKGWVNFSNQQLLKLKKDYDKIKFIRGQ